MTRIACGHVRQLPMFEDEAAPPAPQARQSDPPTSHAAALEQQRSGRASCHAAIILRVLNAATEPLCYREIHRRCEGEIIEPVEVMRRLDGLRAVGLVVTGPARECRVSGRQAMTWRCARAD